MSLVSHFEIIQSTQNVIYLVKIFHFVINWLIFKEIIFKEMCLIAYFLIIERVESEKKREILGEFDYTLNYCEL